MKTSLALSLALLSLAAAPLTADEAVSLDTAPSATSCSASSEAVNDSTVTTHGLRALPLTLEEPTETTTCTVDCDCPYGQVCDAGTCTLDFGPFPQCRCDAECDPGEVCVSGHCETDDSCIVDCDCDRGQVCDGGECTLDFGPFPQCRCDAECPSGQHCVDGGCRDLTL